MIDGKENFSQMHEEHRRIFEELKARHLSGHKVSRKPSAIILLGQPGSISDSLMTSLTQASPDKDFVMIDVEELRRQHPRYEHVVREDDDSVMKQITADARSWEKSLLQTAMKGQMDIIIRDSRCDAGAVSDTVRRLRENGYTSSVYVVSAHERESLLSLYQNYEGAVSSQGYGERPRLSEHEASYESFLRY